MQYYIKQGEEIVLADTDLQRLEYTQSLMPQYAGLEIHSGELERGHDGIWYLLGTAPAKPYTKARREEYPDISEQLDQIYWDKINNTNKWVENITAIKNKYPK